MRMLQGVANSFLPRSIVMMGVLCQIGLGQEPQRLPEPIQRRLVVPVTDVTFFDAKGVAMIDTGSSAGIDFDADQAPRLNEYQQGITRTTSFTGAIKDLRAWKEVPLELRELGTISVMATEVDGLRKVFQGFPIDVRWVIGMEVLNGRVFRMNANSGGISISTTPFTPTEECVSLQMQRTKRGCPLLPIALPILGTLDFKIDTGFTGGITLTQDTIDLCLRNRSIQTITLANETNDVFGNKRRPPHYLLKRAMIGKISFHNVLVSLGNEERVGMMVLRHLDCTFDFTNDVAYFNRSEGSSADIYMQIPADGVIPKRIGDSKILVSEIDLNGAAALAGIRKGDIIRALNGRPLSEFGAWERIDLVSNIGTTVVFEIERESDVLSIGVPLQHSFPFPPAWPEDPPVFDPGKADQN